MRLPAAPFALLCVRLAIFLAACDDVRAQATPRPQLYVVRNVRLAPAADAPQSTLILRDGRIELVQGAGVEPPAGARVVDGKGMLALPAFVDAYTQTGCVAPAPIAERDAAPKASAEALVDMREANRKGIQPSFRAAEVFKLDADAGKRWRGVGFGLLLSAPAGQFLAGQSTLASTRDAPGRDVLVEPVEFDHAGFEAPGPGYPGTLMGAVAHLRQFFLDANRLREIESRRAAGKPGARPPFDADLEAIAPALQKKRRIVCEADTVGDIERWIRLSDEFGFDVAISGGRDAWKRAALLKQRGIPVFLTLEWGEEVEDPHAKDKKKEAAPEPPKAEEPKKDEPKKEEPKKDEPKKEEPKKEEPKSDAKEGIFQEALRVREEKRRLWEETRDNAIRLAEAGVPIAFGTGKGSPKDLLDHVRTLIEKGMPADVARQALTSGSATLLGVGSAFGKIEPGFGASIALWTKDPLASKDAKVAWIFLDGFATEFEVKSDVLEGKPDEGVDATGTWELEFDNPRARPATAELKMEKEGDVHGTLRFKSPNDETERSAEFEGHVAGKKIRLTGRVKFGNFEADVVIEGEIEKDEMKGTEILKFPNREDSRAYKATRKPHREEDR